jgi:hypothetical protein
VSENGQAQRRHTRERSSARVNSLRDITVSYEGRDEQIVVKPPNLSKRGMFINTALRFPEGAVLNLRFRLCLTGAEIQTRCEVRYCEPGIGVGVEFFGLPVETQHIIEQEIAWNEDKAKRRAPRRRTKKESSANGARHKRRS